MKRVSALLGLAAASWMAACSPAAPEAVSAPPVATEPPAAPAPSAVHIKHVSTGASIDPSCAAWPECEALARGIAQDDVEAWAALIGPNGGVRLQRHGATQVEGLDFASAEAFRAGAASRGGLRALLGVPAGAAVSARVARDCTRCRRAYVGIELIAGDRVVDVMLDGGFSPLRLTSVVARDKPR